MFMAPVLRVYSQVSGSGQVTVMDTRAGQAGRSDAQDFFVQTLEQWGDAVVVVDDQGLVRLFNAAAEQFWGRPRLEVVDTHVDTLLPLTLNGDVDSAGPRELAIVRPDGEERWGAMSLSTIRLPGHELYAVLLKDITGSRAQDSEQRLLSMAINASRSATCIVDAHARLVYVNDGLLHMLGYDRAALLGQSPLMFFVGDSQAGTADLPELAQLFGDNPHEISALVSKRNGQRLWVHVSSSPVLDACGQVECSVMVLTDITRSKLHEVLQDKVVGALLNEQPLENVLSLMCREIERIAPEVIVSILSVDAAGILHPLAGPGLPAAYSQAIEGLSIGPFAGSCGTAAFRGEPVLVTDIATDPLWADYRELAEQSGLRACWSIPVRNSSGQVAATFALYFRECRGPDPLHAHLVTAGTHLCMLALERVQARQAIRKMAFYDSLTGLPNRSFLLGKAQRLLFDVAQEQGELAVLFIDLDRFKQVNDALGHGAGDELLQVMAQRLSSVMRDADIAGRLSGDEFVLVLPRRNATQVTRELERLQRVLSFPVSVGETSVVMSASIGISLYPADGQDMESLLQCADIAMYQAKRVERGSCRFYLEQMNQIAQQRLILETALRMALAGDGLELAYQPQINLHTGALVGVEALARWEHPSLGVISPERFIPLAEECGLINELSQWVLQTACGQLAEWRLQGLVVPSMSINLSPINFQGVNLPTQIAQQLQHHQLQASDLCIELTEGVLLSNSMGTEHTLAQLHALGVRLAIDDFGTGYSSLGYLRHLPISELKLDKSFVDDLERDASCRALSESVIGIGKGLSLLVVAEGIEHAAQCEILKAQGYEVGQGFFFSLPLASAAFMQWLRTNQGAPLVVSTEPAHVTLD